MSNDNKDSDSNGQLEAVYQLSGWFGLGNIKMFTHGLYYAPIPAIYLFDRMPENPIIFLTLY